MTSRVLRDKRRTEAREALPNLVRAASKIHVNDEIGSHITIWPKRGLPPVQWWPGTARWSDPGDNQGKHKGGISALRNFLWHLAGAPPLPTRPDPFAVIDEEDRS